MNRRLQAPERGPYDFLYTSRRGLPLWGATPGRLIRALSRSAIEGKVAIDLGCGDGKNSAHLEAGGCSVVGVDISAEAIDLLMRQRERRPTHPQSEFYVGDVNDLPAEYSGSFDLVVSYGLFHCLDRSSRVGDHRRLNGFCKPEAGKIIFSTLTDSLPLPPEHKTPGVVLASRGEINEVFSGFEILEDWEGEIHEDHLPAVGPHSHSVRWIVARP